MNRGHNLIVPVQCAPGPFWLIESRVAHFWGRPLTLTRWFTGAAGKKQHSDATWENLSVSSAGLGEKSIHSHIDSRLPPAYVFAFPQPQKAAEIQSNASFMACMTSKWSAWPLQRKWRLWVVGKKGWQCRALWLYQEIRHGLVYVCGGTGSSIGPTVSCRVGVTVSTIGCSVAAVAPCQWISPVEHFLVASIDRSYSNKSRYVKATHSPCSPFHPWPPPPTPPPRSPNRPLLLVMAPRARTVMSSAKIWHSKQWCLSEWFPQQSWSSRTLGCCVVAWASCCCYWCCGCWFFRGSTDKSLVEGGGGTLQNW